jgi:putative spermidine/putrescine transport system substrate-binding protein
MFSKRMFLAATTLAYGLALGAAFAAEPLSVMSFGGAYQEAQRKAVFSAYAKKLAAPFPNRNTVARSPRSRR